MDTAQGEYLLLGDPQDPWCLAVGAALEAEDHAVRTVANPLVDPACFSWHLDNGRSESRLDEPGNSPLTDRNINGVFVRHAAWIDPAGWQADDLAYMHAELQAALIAWLHSLACPVVNRYPAAIWYQPQTPLLSWHPLLRQCGLPVLETLITNVPQEAHAMRLRLARAGVPGAIYGPLTSSARYRLATDEDWDRLTAMQEYAPACLPYPHGEIHSLCIVDEQVIWNGQPLPEAVRWEPALCRFAAAAGLNFVALSLADASEGPCIVSVEPHPQFEQFGEAARQSIVKKLVELLTAGNNRRHETSIQLSPGSSR